MSDLRTRLQTSLDQYRIESQVGEGRMAVVFLAEDVKHHRRVALKVMKPEVGASLGSERFLREIDIAAKLSHPHIVPLYDSGEVARTRPSSARRLDAFCRHRKVAGGDPDPPAIPGNSAADGAFRAGLIAGGALISDCVAGS